MSDRHYGVRRLNNGRMTTIEFPTIELEGIIVYYEDQHALVLNTDEGPARLSTNLEVYGIEPGSGEATIKDYSEHEGLTDNLVKLGLVEIIKHVTFGPFNSRGYLVKVL